MKKTFSWSSNADLNWLFFYFLSTLSCQIPFWEMWQGFRKKWFLCRHWHPVPDFFHCHYNNNKNARYLWDVNKKAVFLFSLWHLLCLRACLSPRYYSVIETAAKCIRESNMVQANRGIESPMTSFEVGTFCWASCFIIVCKNSLKPNQYTKLCVSYRHVN